MLGTKFCGNDPDNQSANCSRRQDRGHGFRDDCIGQTQEDSEEYSDNPAGPWELYVADNESEAEAGNERAEHRGTLVWKVKRDHQRNIQTAEDQSANYT